MIALKPGTGLHTISFDLDGTLAEPTWPEPRIGNPIPQGVALLKEMFGKGYECIIFTSRPAGHREAIAAWLFEHRLTDYVYDIVTGKPRALAYIDDRAITFPEAVTKTMMVTPNGSLHELEGGCAAWGCKPA